MAAYHAPGICERDNARLSQVATLLAREAQTDNAIEQIQHCQTMRNAEDQRFYNPMVNQQTDLFYSHQYQTHLLGALLKILRTYYSGMRGVHMIGTGIIQYVNGDWVVRDNQGNTTYASAFMKGGRLKKTRRNIKKRKTLRRRKVRRNMH